jgi:hypothetical protein
VKLLINSVVLCVRKGRTDTELHRGSTEGHGEFNTKMSRNFLLCTSILCLYLPSNSQDTVNSDTLNRKQLRNVIIFESAVAVTTLVGLSVLWYADYPKSSFHFINDNDEWLQLDKFAHVTASYYIGKVGYELLRSTGVERKKAIWFGGSTGFVYLGMVEIMDGFSAGWGASMGDVMANATGTAAFIGQQFAWDEQRILLKWSFHMTDYAQYNPEQLGSTFPQRMMKDYNGQTYWLSGNIRSFIHKESRFPGWLNVAVGYSGDGMIGARENPSEIDGNPVPYFVRTRQYFLAPDIDLTRIKTKSPFLKMVFNIFGVLKFPLPAVEYNGVQSFVFHPVYF